MAKEKNPQCGRKDCKFCCNGECTILTDNTFKDGICKFFKKEEKRR